MATIKIERTKEFNNSMRNYKIFIDGKEVGAIANGAQSTFSTTAGHHTVTAKIDWCSSPNVDIVIAENENKTLKVGGAKNIKWLLWLWIGVIVLHFILSIAIGFMYTIFLMAPLLFVVIYYLTIGRKNYLTLKEINNYME